MEEGVWDRTCSQTSIPRIGMFPEYPRVCVIGLSWFGVASIARPPLGATVSQAQPEPNTPCEAAVKFDLNVAKLPKESVIFCRNSGDGAVELTGARVCCINPTRCYAIYQDDTGVTYLPDDTSRGL